MIDINLKEWLIEVKTNQCLEESSNYIYTASKYSHSLLIKMMRIFGKS